MTRISTVVACILFLPSLNEPVEAEIGESNSFFTHLLDSPHQAEETTLRVLLPDKIEEGKRYPALYILPVHEDGLFRHGDGLEEVRNAGYRNR